MTKRIMWACAVAAAIVWWKIVLWALLGYVVFWLWLVFGFRNHCPSCGRSLEDEWDTTVRDSCACGWRRGG